MSFIPTYKPYGLIDRIDPRLNERSKESPSSLKIKPSRSLNLSKPSRPTKLSIHKKNDPVKISWSFQDWLSEKRNPTVEFLHSLSSEASGLMLWSNESSLTQKWIQQVNKKEIKQEFFFISALSKGDKVKEKNFTKNGIDFLFQKSNAEFQLWKAIVCIDTMDSSKHLRKIATECDFPLLGDTQFQGRNFFRICLHSYKFETKEPLQTPWIADVPSYFKDLDLLFNQPLCALLEGAHLRDQLLQFNLLESDSSYRLIHNEYPELRMDCYGEQIWVYDYTSNDLQLTVEKNKSVEVKNKFENTIKVDNTIELLKKFFEIYPQKPTWVREMKNRGSQPLESKLSSLNSPQNRWVCKENGVQFELRSDQGLSPGLFLDQRENRKWVLNESSGRRVLNLFAYTCGFSVCAAKGGATEVVSVDVSPSFLDWGKQNFKLNQLNDEKFEFWANDCISFIQRTVKMKRTFDLIICDPPSFGRSKQGVFKIDQDLPTMLQDLIRILAINGVLLLTTNFEKWTQTQFENVVLNALPRNKFQLITPPKSGLDFIDTETHRMKSIMLKNKV